MKTNWISVKDRLPVERGVYIVSMNGYSPSPFVFPMLFDKFFNGQWRWQTPDKDCEFEITHWMPLPTAPILLTSESTRPARPSAEVGAAKKDCSDCFYDSKEHMTHTKCFSCFVEKKNFKPINNQTRAGE
jgi:hypothetical protein